MRARSMTLVALLIGTAIAGMPITLSAASAAITDTGPLSMEGMKYRMIGPFRGGRATGVAGVPGDPTVYYAGMSSGGLWKTTDAGRSWAPLWDKFPEASPAVGAVVVSPSDPNVIYAGTGEGGAPRGNVVGGNGVFKSTDGGKSWAYAGLRTSEFIGRMAISSTDPNLVFVAAGGSLFRDGGERGVYRTRDGGKTWQRVLFVDDKTGAVDVQIDPTNPNIVWAAMWQVHRKPWIMESGGPGSGLYRSTDGGTTWQKQTGKGLPAGILGKIGVAPAADGKRVYALIEAEKGGLYRTDDGGASWQLINADNAYKQRAWYYTNIFADPKDANKVFVMNTGAYRSTDGGKSFKSMPTFHGDNHQLWINPADPRYMVNSNDGAVNVSVNGGDSWTQGDNQPTGQIYHIAVDNQVPYNIYGAQQDNTTVRIASASVSGGITMRDWQPVGGGESGYVVPDPKDPHVVIAGSYWGEVSRYDDRTGQAIPIKPWPHETMGWAPKDVQHRGQWTEPLLFSPHDPNTLYNANEVVFKSTNNGQSWDIISPDLTRNDKTKQQSSGGPLTKDNTSVELFGVVFSLAESPVQKDLIWAGTDDGLIQVTSNGGKAWANVTPKDMPEWGTVDMVEPHPKKAGTAYIAVERHKLGDLKPYAFRTDDFGKSWVPITNGLPADAYVHVVRADPARDGLLYAGTENGIFVSLDDGAHWKPLSLNMPRVPVHDLAVHPTGDLAVATHGRAFWVLDDLTPLRQWSDAIAQEPVHLFTPRPTLRMLYSGRGDSMTKFTGENPPTGAILYYNLGKDVAPDAIKLEILDASDTVIRSFKPSARPAARPSGDEDEDEAPRAPAPSLGTKAGLNRFAWDMRVQGPVQVPKSAMWHASTLGPIAIPGQYKARLTVNGQVQTQPIEIVANPNVKVTQAELKEQFDLALAINRELSMVQDAVLEIRELHAKLAETRKAAGGKRAVIKAADTLEAKVNAVEDKLIQKLSIANEDPLNFPVRLNNQLASLALTVGTGDNKPTKQAYAEFDILKAQATAYLAEWSKLKTGELAGFNSQIGKARLEPVSITPQTAI
ncbi:WD40/YVTN/BNR-like repeat-containing protein [Sphingomonas quercus]|uniref:Glycosyl hydrolase n=1 Tax=Sphingomonas quercus TaxID=2842451 RepID=A0ABS6BIW1_9SPHN|nr:glycosyl hydrolase [Sphingomonas quercus]MBU3078242.1 glycosyl hydrolase [Sphingomonas quercus]